MFMTWVRRVCMWMYSWWYGALSTGVHVKRVIVIDHDTFTYIPWDPAECIGRRWESYVEQVLGYPLSDEGRVEIRYTDGAFKKRLVLYPGDYCDPTFPKPPKRIFLSAHLITKEGARGSPVLSRVQKYHGSALQCASHMFPFEDWDVLKETYSHVDTVDLFFNRDSIQFSEAEKDSDQGGEKGL